MRDLQHGYLLDATTTAQRTTQPRSAPFRAKRKAGRGD
jgi:hypothetical protein